MRRIILSLSIVIVFGVAPGLMILNPLSSALAETPREQRQESPNKSTTTTALPPKDPTAPLPQEEPEPDIRTIPVTAWGTKVINETNTLSLQARNTEPGDLPETVQVNFDLCALVDTAISDTKDGWTYDITVDVIRTPEDELLDGEDATGGYEEYSLPSVIIVDNTPMVNQVLAENSTPDDSIYGDAGDLVSVLRKGTCTTASVEVKRADRDELVFGFLYWTMPFGEFRIGGGVTQLGEQGPTTIRYLYENN
jgi:hypothetical protein